MKTIRARVAEILEETNAVIAGGPPAPRAALPLGQKQTWPWWTLPIVLFKAEADAGLGDTIARVIGPIGGETYKAWYLETFGKSCGCAARQEDLNQQFPYAHAARSTHPAPKG